MVKPRGKCSHMIRNKWYEIECAEDVLADILSRLPVKWLLLCKSVCKLWNRVISSQLFIDFQLMQSRKCPCFIIYPYRDLHLQLYVMKATELKTMFTSPFWENDYNLCIIASVDGLIFCVNHAVLGNTTDKDGNDLEIRIYNPATKNVLLLPRGSPSKKLPRIGVAFGPKINEYKVFRFFCAKHNPPAEGKSRPNYYCEVYSSSTGSWRVIGHPPGFPMPANQGPLLGSNHIFLNGKVHWFVASKEDRKVPGSILTVDVEENFGKIDLPQKITKCSYLVNLEGCLSLLVVYDESRMLDIWILKDCHKLKWEKKCSVLSPFSELEPISAVVALKSEILFMTDFHYLLYNVEDRIWRNLVNMPDPLEQRRHPAVFTYTESLLSTYGRPSDPEAGDTSNGSST
ncbi:hypothetical protein SLE2022_017800 [Rubroshorea leprosula]